MQNNKTQKSGHNPGFFITFTPMGFTTGEVMQDPPEPEKMIAPQDQKMDMNIKPQNGSPSIMININNQLIDGHDQKQEQNQTQKNTNDNNATANTGCMAQIKAAFSKCCCR
jgi:hypothetical protein